MPRQRPHRRQAATCSPTRAARPTTCSMSGGGRRAARRHHLRSGRTRPTVSARSGQVGSTASAVRSTLGGGRISARGSQRPSSMGPFSVGAVRVRWTHCVRRARGGRMAQASPSPEAGAGRPARRAPSGTSCRRAGVVYPLLQTPFYRPSCAAPRSGVSSFSTPEGGPITGWIRRRGTGWSSEYSRQRAGFVTYTIEGGRPGIRRAGGRIPYRVVASIFAGRPCIRGRSTGYSWTTRAGWGICTGLVPRSTCESPPARTTCETSSTNAASRSGGTEAGGCTRVGPTAAPKGTRTSRSTRCACSVRRCDAEADGTRRRGRSRGQ